MKRKSILVSLIVAVLAAMTFVGCSDAVVFPPMPQSVKSGYIIQNGDFLTGQAFDSSKFTVMVVYDNGEEAVLPTASVVLTGNVEANADISALVGYNSENNPVYATGSLVAYDINRLEVTSLSGTSEYPVEIGADGQSVTIPASDLVVTAYYLKNGTETSVQLSSTEFTVEENFDGDKIDLSADAPSIDLVATISAKVGYEYPVDEQPTAAYPYTAVYAIADTDIVSVEAAEFKAGTVVPALVYGDVPAPNAGDIELTVKYANGTTGTKVAPTEDMELAYVVGATGLELEENDLTGMVGSNVLGLAVTFNGKTVVSKESAASVVAASPVVTARSSFDTEYVRGEALPALDKADFMINLKVGDKYQKIEDLENVELSYYAYVGTSYAALDSDDVVPATGNLYVAATYMGKTSVVANDSTCEAYKIADIESAKTTTYMTFTYAAAPVSLVEDFEGPAKQYYNDITPVMNSLTADALEPIEIIFKTGEDPVTIDPSELEVAYSREQATYTAEDGIVIKALDDKSFVDENGNGSLVMAETGAKLYVVVSYTYVDPETGNTTVYYDSIEVKEFATAVADEFELELTYKATDPNENPMLGTTVSKYELTSSNDNGIVSIADITTSHTGITLLVDGVAVADGTAWTTITVGETAKTVEIYTDGSDATAMIHASAAIPVGTDYVAATTDIEVELTTAGAAKLFRIGDVYANVFTASDFTATATTNGGDEVALEITGIEVAPTLKATAVKYDLPVRVSYVNDAGIETTTLKTAEVTAVEYVVPASTGFGISYDGKTYENGDTIPVPTSAVSISNFTAALYTAYKETATQDNALVKIEGSLYRGADFSLDENRTLIAGDVLTFTISYVDGTTATKTDDVTKWPTRQVELTVVAPEA